jgi:hypothetical protein
MAEHYASVTIDAPVHQVYSLFTHFRDFPTFLCCVKEVMVLDEQRTHWVVHVLRDYEWDAVNEDWIPDQQIGWRSTRGLLTSGKVKFRSIESQRTMVDVYLHYTPPFGPLGRLVDMLDVGGRVEAILKEDLAHFACMVEQMPSQSLEPMASHYLLHSRSAVATRTITTCYERAMQQDPRMSADALAERQARIEREQEQQRITRQEQILAEQEKHEREQQAMQQQQTILAQEAHRRIQEEKELAEEQARHAQEPRIWHPVYDTLGGRDASRDRTAFGDRDAIRPRHPDYERSPMSARYPLQGGIPTRPLTEEETETSPWFNSIRGIPLLSLSPLAEPDRSGAKEE